MEWRITGDLIVAHCLFGWFLVPVAQKALKRTPTQFWRGNEETDKVFGSEALRIEDTWPQFDFAPAEICPFSLPLGGSQTCATFWSLWVIFPVYRLRVNKKKKGWHPTIRYAMVCIVTKTFFPLSDEPVFTLNGIRVSIHLAASRMFMRVFSPHHSQQ